VNIYISTLYSVYLQLTHTSKNSLRRQRRYLTVTLFSYLGSPLYLRDIPTYAFGLLRPVGETIFKSGVHGTWSARVYQKFSRFVIGRAKNCWPQIWLRITIGLIFSYVAIHHENEYKKNKGHICPEILVVNIKLAWLIFTING
jgi:hypothetical protein